MKKLTRKDEKILMVKAMEYICRQINDEDIFMGWLMSGVADGDMEYGDFSIDDVNAECYVEDDEDFADLMACFLRRMKFASDSGGLYCGGVTSSDC